MDGPRLLLLLLLGPEGAGSLSRDQNSEENRAPPPRKLNRALGSQMLRAGGGRGALMLGPRRRV
ncbi:hypothetical protein P7K49_011465 [Saguinus oedipus]|uniref:Uncharacterized protein n=1 Tax=Saguinus oedipus TaxID=9490 RepID=A0ABQ9VQQ9_SAGOE|nr:hypothetical protein P7K49_011465 [Saguinus oedipus]